MITMQSPIFGKCILRPQDEPPTKDYKIGYVALEGKEKLTIAIFKDVWRDRNLKRFKQPVTRWYAVETEDGRQVL
ncbi:hypothetical protein [Croceicoccus bisphenolivorans]|uniref:hypothetical protein n=1 Tax=Croceicoccus bisphenolivorans TaxID=1783232 RepID=UPI0008335055|nr:hypothetical protein [Croceicoccus bisphenolivorans]